MSSVHDLRALAQSQYVLWPLSVHVTDRSHVGWLDSEKGMQGCALNSHHLKDYGENITTFFLMPSEFLKNRLHFSFSQQRKIYALVFPLRGCSFFIIQMRWQSPPLLKMLFLAPVDFLFPSGLIAFCCTLVILWFHFIHLWV